MNIERARKALEDLTDYGFDKASYEYLLNFFDEVEKLLENNSIKQTPALFKPFEVKNE